MISASFCRIEFSRVDTSMLSNVTGGSFARSRATNVGVSVPFSCSKRMISLTFCTLRFGPIRLRMRVQLSSAQSSRLRRLDVVLGERRSTQIPDRDRGQDVDLILTANHVVRSPKQAEEVS